MAFESQLAATRAFTRSRVASNEFLLRVVDRKRGQKSDVILDVRLPLEIATTAKLRDERIDVFWDHESGKGMIARALGGLKLTSKERESVASQQFVFAKGFTPDFGLHGLRVTRFETVKHGDEDALVFDYPSVTMVTGRNELKAGEQPTRAQVAASKLVKPADVQAAVGGMVIAPIKTKPAAAPAKAAKAAAKKKPGKPGRKPAKRARRVFTDDDKKQGVRAHIGWMNEGLSFHAAALKVKVSPPLMKGWHDKFGKQVKREMAKGAPIVGAPARLNGADAAAVRH